MPSELAKAKVNLCLHVVGRQDDGLHLLDSIVVFPTIGDELVGTVANDLSLEISGEFSGGLSDTDNLVLDAANLFDNPRFKFELQKNLPVASGIGGGSADAAAAIRLIAKLDNLAVPSIDKLALLGADIPVCVAQKPSRMSGIGDVLTAVPKLPKFWILLVNSGAPVSTAAVFATLTSPENTAMSELPASFSSATELFEYLRGQRNDLEAPAIKVCPEIQDVLREIRATDDCRLTRMSGSGGTCFGLFATENAALAAKIAVSQKNPEWWVASAEV